MPNYRFDHVHLMSPDPMKTAEFYEDIFGVKKVVRDLGNGRFMAELNLNGAKILISKQADDSEQKGLVHFGIETDDLSEAVEELKVKGVEFTMDITEVRPGFKISFLLAQDNVSIELQEGAL